MANDTVSCGVCETEIKPSQDATCDACFAEAVDHDVREELEAARPSESSITTADIREWAYRRVLLGQMSKDIHELFILCAEDLS